MILSNPLVALTLHCSCLSLILKFFFLAVYFSAHAVQSFCNQTDERIIENFNLTESRRNEN